MSEKYNLQPRKGFGPKNPLTEEEQLEFDLQLEAELARTQRQHRIFERNRTTYTSGAKIVKQRRVINVLEKENVNILRDLYVATSSTKKQIDTKITGDLYGLLGEQDGFDHQIKEKSANLKEIDVQIDKVQRAVVVIRSKLPTDVHYQERILTGQKTVEALENKLDTANKICCTILNGNQNLRDEIKHLLLERIDFNKIWEKLIENLNRGKAFMLDLIEQASIAYNQREEWCHKLQALRLRGHSDLINHTLEMQQLQRKIDHDSALEQFLIIKGRKRVMNALEERQLLQQQEKSRQMQRWQEELKGTLAQILDFTAVETIPDLIKKFYSKENENFTLFEFIVGMHTEVESLTQDIATAYCQIDEENARHKEYADHQKDILIKLRAQLQETTYEVNECEATVARNAENLQALYDGINKLSTICRCNVEPILQLLGSSAKMNDDNILLHLQILEDDISELIMGVYMKEKMTSALKKAKTEVPIIDETQVALPVFPITKIIPTNPCPLCVEQKQVSDVIDTLQFTLSRDAVKLKLQQRLMLPGALDWLHNVSLCHLPKSREIIQRRYQ